ncbi:hypothetical protein UPYG_G00041780 [Umbra pygmaea]|uniref:Uncharacterized protein n=1 Tax=Umbra pygmaea TaxID=75934 RepID=A0ABD0YE74_UMBPY
MHLLLPPFIREKTVSAGLLYSHTLCSESNLFPPLPTSWNTTCSVNPAWTDYLPPGA